MLCLGNSCQLPCDISFLYSNVCLHFRRGTCRKVEGVVGDSHFDENPYFVTFTFFPVEPILT